MKWLLAILILPCTLFAQVDSVTNFAKANISTLYGASDTLIVLDSLGSRFPVSGYNLVWWDATTYGDPSDDPKVEIVRVESRSGDTLDVLRAQEGTSASTKNTAGKKYRVILSATAVHFNQIRDSLNTKLAARDTASLSARINLKADTSAVLFPYDTLGYVATAYDISLKINLADSMKWILRQDSLLRDPTGFYDRASTITFTDADHEFKIVGPFDVYSQGVKYSKASDSITVDSTSAIHYIYYDSTGTLRQSTSLWVINSRNAPVATVYYNATTAKGILGDERHGFMPGIVHEWVHEAIGARYVSGMSGSFGNDTLRITAGEWYDDDLEYVTAQTDTVRVFYRNGADWEWTDPQRRYFDTLVNVPAYDNAGTRTAVSVSKFSNSWVFATNSTTYPIVVVMGQAEYNTQALAEAASPSSLAFNALPVKEALLLYKVTWQRDGSNIVYKSTTDYRAGNVGSVANYVATDHRALTHLDFASSGHTGFVGWTDTTATIATLFDISSKLNSSDTTGFRTYSNTLYNEVTFSTTYDSTVLSTYGTRFVRSFFSTYSDSVIVDSVRAISRARASGDTVTIRIIYGVNGAATDSLADVKCYHATGVSVAQTKTIPPNNDVYVKIIEEDGAAPEIAFTVKGRKKR